LSDGAPWRVELARTAQRDLQRLDPKSVDASSARYVRSQKTRNAPERYTGSLQHPNRGYGSATGAHSSHSTPRLARSTSFASCRAAALTATNRTRHPRLVKQAPTMPLTVDYAKSDRCQLAARETLADVSADQTLRLSVLLERGHREAG
jgi:hypothetical protein